MLNEIFKSCVNEKDVENIYRVNILKYFKDGVISSPYNTDGVLKFGDSSCLLEFKYNVNMNNSLERSKVIAQAILYLKTMLIKDGSHPSVVFIGDINECFSLHTNALNKYFNYDIDWNTPPSKAGQIIELISDISKDEECNPFVFNLENVDSFDSIFEHLVKTNSANCKKVAICEQNIEQSFKIFRESVFKKKTHLTINDIANLFIQVLVNPEENYLYPKKKNLLVTKSYGQIAINSDEFNNFFKYYDDSSYSRADKKNLLSIIDRLVEDNVRRFKGEFYTPTHVVNLAHTYIEQTFGEDWKEKYTVWDCCWGTGNLTRDYKFSDLYVSTLERNDLETADQLKVNKEAKKFQFDFLNDEDHFLPNDLLDKINSGKEILFLINPPYGTAVNMNTKNGATDIKTGISKTNIRDKMKLEDYGRCTEELSVQFLYRIIQYQKVNKNIKLCVINKINYLQSESYNKFRPKFFNQFAFKNGFLVNASEFSGTSAAWGVSFACFDSGVNNSPAILDVIEFEKFVIKNLGHKEFYNIDEIKSADKWLKEGSKEFNKRPFVDTPPLTSALNVKNGNVRGKSKEGSIGYFLNAGNNVVENGKNVSLFSSRYSNGHGTDIFIPQLLKITTLFTARRVISPNWVIIKDEYMYPNVESSAFKELMHDSIVYALFDKSSQQSSMSNIEYNGKIHHINNEFFWLSKDFVQQLAEEYKFADMEEDIEFAKDRIYYSLVEDNKQHFSKEANDVLNAANELFVKSFKIRELVSNNNPEYHLHRWDAGYAQLKLIWKEHFPEEFKQFRTLFLKFRNKLIPKVYEAGFLK